MATQLHNRIALESKDLVRILVPQRSGHLIWDSGVWSVKQGSPNLHKRILQDKQMQETVCICPVQCVAHSRCSTNINRTSSEMKAVTRWAVLSITGSDSPLQVLASVELKPTSHSFQLVALGSEGRSGTNTIKRRGEKPSSAREQRGRSGQEERTAHEGECSLKSIRTHHPASLLAVPQLWMDQRMTCQCMMNQDPEFLGS